MSATLLLLLGALVSTTPAPAPSFLCAALGARVPVAPGSAVDPELREIYRAGVPWSDFLDAAEARRDLWVENWETSAALDPAVVARVEAVGGEWHLLAIAVDGCSDSVSTLPFLARLAEQADNLHLRIVDPETGAALMAAHRTPDGRTATPTFLLLDRSYDRVGCLVERPDRLRDHILENPDGLDRNAIYQWKMAWYAGNAGRDTVEQTAAMIEAAADGEMMCAPVTGGG